VEWEGVIRTSKRLRLSGNRNTKYLVSVCRQYLFLAVFSGRLRLVQPRESPVMPLVQPPSLLDREILLVDGVEDDVEGGVRAGEEGRVRNVKLSGRRQF
jgi:hypothetical protein